MYAIIMNTGTLISLFGVYPKLPGRRVMAKHKQTTILSGPNGEALFESFKNHYKKRRDVSFFLINCVVVVGSIYALAYEDGSGKRFMFEMSDYSGKCYKGYYDTERTTGWITAVTN